VPTIGELKGSAGAENSCPEDRYRHPDARDAVNLAVVINRDDNWFRDRTSIVRHRV